MAEQSKTLDVEPLDKDKEALVHAFVDYLDNYIEHEVEQGALLSEAVSKSTLENAAEAFAQGSR